MRSPIVPFVLLLVTAGSAQQTAASPWVSMSPSMFTSRCRPHHRQRHRRSSSSIPPPPAATAMPTPAVVAAPVSYQERSHPATLGLELTAINGRVIGWGASAGTGIAVVIHPLDAYPLDVSIDYRRDVFLDDPDERVDHRINYSLYLGPQAPALAPYVVIPMGVNIVTRAEMATVVEGFVGIGLGGRLRVTDHFTIRGDARIESRGQATSQDQDPDPTLPANEVALSAQVSAGYYF